MSGITSVDNNSQIQSGNHVTRRAGSGLKTFIQRLIARKPMGQLQAEIEIKNDLRRTLNWVQLTGIGLGCTIGAGIFVLSGHAASQYAGPSVIISFIVTGIIALLSALSYSEMASMMSSSGSAYTYTYVALGEYLAWFIGWNSALLYQLACLTVVVGWGEYVVHLIDIISDYNATRVLVESPVAWNETSVGFYVTGQVINLPAIAITIGITILLIIGIRETAMVNMVLVVIKIIILLIFIFVTCRYVNRNNYKPFFPSNLGSFSEFGVTGMLQACTYVFFALVGFDAVTGVAQEARDPTRSLPIAILTSVVVSILIYVGISTVMVGLVSYTLLDTDNPLSTAVNATPYGLWLLIVMDLAAIAGLTTVAITVLLAQTRIFYAMAHDGLLPPIFAKLYSRTKTPWVSTVISGVLCAVIAGICPVDIIGETTTISALITYIFVHIGIIVMRYTHEDMPRAFRVPFGAWLIPVIGSLLCILLMKGVTKETGYRFLIWTGLGQIIYFSYGYWHSKKRNSSRMESLNSTLELVPTAENIDKTSIRTESEPDVTSET